MAALTEIFQTSQVPAEVCHFSKTAKSAIAGKRNQDELEWFGEIPKRGVFVIEFGGLGVQSHMVVIEFMGNNGIGIGLS